jgi:nicotinamide mononucleotide (NMN) deamidase PncC
LILTGVSLVNDPAVTEIVGRIHAAPTRLVLAVNGGSQAIAALLVRPGGSRTLLEAVVPYSNASLAEFLRATPENFCSARTARAMAMAAFLRARRLLAADSASAESPLDDASVAGAACSASLMSDRPKKGPHRIHVAAQTAGFTTTHSVELVKGRRNRREEEGLAAKIMLNTVAEASGLADRLFLDLLADERLVSQRTPASEDWRDLLLGRTRLVQQNAGGMASNSPARNSGTRAIFSGAFNPLHDGHRRMAQMAEELLGVPVEFEISIENVDKPPLDYTEMAERAAQFASFTRLWFSRAATFEQKSALFPNATFVVGADTIVRIADARYSGREPPNALAAIEQIAAHGARFLVFGRTLNGEFQTLAQLGLPPQLLALCHEISLDQFRADLSSTELRQKGTGVH